MCGIAGCISKRGKAIDKGKFEKMVDIIKHRGPDDQGVFFENNLALGHRRLSIIDLSKDGHQPFCYENRYIVVFNGEIYNYLELKKKLQKEGYYFYTKTDTEVIAAAYACWKDRCVEYFNGMWAFIVYDKEAQRFFCSRDRFGVKPFYYTEQENMFLVASEIKQFFELLEDQPKADRECLLQYLIRGNIDYSNRTMFRDVYQLQGGHNLVYDLRAHCYKIEKYYDIRKIEEHRESYGEACQKFRNLFFESVGLRLRADVPVGFALSGGLDSSAIVCVADQIGRERNLTEQHTISSCFEDKRYDEQEYIDEVIKKTAAVSHKVFPQEEELFLKLDDIIWHMDEPFGSTSIYAQWNVFEAAKQNGLKVMLDGQGADEQLAGYTSFYTVMFAECMKRKKFRRLYKEWKIYKTNRAVTEKHISTKEIMGSAVNVVFMARLKYLIKSMYFLLPGNRMPFSHKQLLEAVQREPGTSKCNVREYIAESLQQGLAPLLHYEDRDSMAHSIESRVPFLDYRLVEAIYAMPFEYKLREGVTKAVLREGLQGVLPEKVQNRYSKLGFVTPEDQWINHNYDKYRTEVKKSLEILEGIVNKEKVLKWFDKKRGKVQRQDFTTWRIICAGHWARIFNVKI